MEVGSYDPTPPAYPPPADQPNSASNQPFGPKTGGGMIFFAVGTERFPFDRLIRTADAVQEQLKDEPVFVQLGPSGVIPQKCSWARLLSHSELVDRLREARMVVTHAGVGMLLLCVRLGKIPIMLPRQKRFGEHVDDHQIELAMKMAQLGYILLAEHPEEIAPLLLNHHDRSPAPPMASSPVPELATALLAYLRGPQK